MSIRMARNPGHISQVVWVGPHGGNHPYRAYPGSHHIEHIAWVRCPTAQGVHATIWSNLDGSPMSLKAPSARRGPPGHQPQSRQLHHGPLRSPRPEPMHHRRRGAGTRSGCVRMGGPATLETLGEARRPGPSDPPGHPGPIPWPWPLRRARKDGDHRRTAMAPPGLDGRGGVPGGGGPPREIAPFFGNLGIWHGT